jgi:hypothetical protein
MVPSMMPWSCDTDRLPDDPEEGLDGVVTSWPTHCACFPAMLFRILVILMEQRGFELIGRKQASHTLLYSCMDGHTLHQSCRRHSLL